MQADLNNQTVLVTGAAGFVGSHLCDALLAQGAVVYGVDNFLTGRSENITHLQTNERFHFIEADVIQPPDTYLPTEVTFDLVFHFASPASPPRYQAYPVATYLVNSYGTHLLLQYLLATNPKGRFVFASTSEVYGDPQVHPQVETYWGNVNPNGPRSCYDEAKRLGETICGVHQRDLGLDVRIVRIFNTYGPRMNVEDGRIIPDFAKQILKGEAVTIHGDGQQTRSYCYVSDLVAGVILLGTKEGIAGATINIGNPGEFTVLQTAEEVFGVAQKLSLAKQSSLEKTFKELPTDDPTRRRPDITQAQTILGWQPTISFAEGLKPTLEFFAATLA
jgi:nucleoside-diphosphate-sugar epimerase